ncbi:hypothetical protein Tco_0016292 [Tanacetum coccineum]
MAPKRATRSNIAPENKTNPHFVTNAQLLALINLGVTDRLAAVMAYTNGVDSHNSGIDNDLKNSKSKDKGSKSRSQSMDEQSHYKQDKTITRQSINVKRHIFDVIGDTEEVEERDLNIGGDC